MNCRWIVVALCGIATPLTLTGTSTSAQEPGGLADQFEQGESAAPIDPQLAPAGIDDDAVVMVVVELESDPVAVVQAESGRTLSPNEKAGITSDIEAEQRPVEKLIESSGGDVVSTLQAAYNGVKALVPHDRLSTISRAPGVAGIHAVETHTIARDVTDNQTAAQYLNADQVWHDTGLTGEGVSIAIIDTGIDYTHADFGGPGTVAAFDAAAATSTAPADPTLFGPAAPRVKGGWDFVGDNYDATSEELANRIPAPDPNPLDCDGHGSHVAGSAAGSGVLDGTTFVGPYDDSTYDNNFDIGPGIAPQADLYALRVFGCNGSTNETIDAIEWAVVHEIDVINLSLGSPFASADDPSAIAAENAVAAGVIVVAAAGNSGPVPYISGAPASGSGVLSVAAVDSAKRRDGYTGTLADGTEIDVLSTNDVAPTGDPYTITDVGAGCLPEDFPAPPDDGNRRVAAATGETCARATRAVLAEQAGYDAAMLINDAPGFPPFEGQITQDPRTGESYVVTIPFIGVTAADGNAVLSADSTAVVFVPSPVNNPSYTNLASFSSSGPRGLDSGIAVNIAAPGMATASAAVGTGNEAAIQSGTSMASPMVAGAAALVRQAQPAWSADEIAIALSLTADPERVGDYQLTRAGAGLVDVGQAVTSEIIAFSDIDRTNNGHVRGATMSFGFREVYDTITTTKTITVINGGDSSAKLSLAAQPTVASVDADIAISPSEVTLDPGHQSEVDVTITVRASDIPPAVDRFGFHEVSGSITINDGSNDLHMPYLLVAHATSNIRADFDAETSTMGLSNLGTTVDSRADIYVWGLQDRREGLSGGNDLRAMGVTSFPFGDATAIVFAVNTYDRYSNGSMEQIEVSIDTNRDGTTDWKVFAFDSGGVHTGSPNGTTEVFLFEIATGSLSSSGFFATAPTDSSTVLLPVLAEDLGIDGAFSYGASTYGYDREFDSFDETAVYDPDALVFPTVDGTSIEVAAGSSVIRSVEIDGIQHRAQDPLGLMVVQIGDEAGAKEADLVPIAAPSGRVDPVISIDDPEPRATLQPAQPGTVTVSASDDVALDVVTVRLETTSGDHIADLGEANGILADEYTATFDLPTGLAAGRYRIVAAAYDVDGGKHVVRSLVVYDDEAPMLETRHPSNGAVVAAGEPVTIRLVAKDLRGLGYVAADLYDATNTTLLAPIGTTSTESPIGKHWIKVEFELPTDLAVGTYTIRSTATDMAGNISSDIRTITIVGTAPTTTIPATTVPATTVPPTTPPNTTPPTTDGPS